jgi:hypothetical protein
MARCFQVKPVRFDFPVPGPGGIIEVSYTKEVESWPRIRILVASLVRWMDAVVVKAWAAASVVARIRVRVPRVAPAKELAAAKVAVRIANH